MIWRYWPVDDLQKEIGETNLKKIGSVLPALDTDGSSLFYLTNKRQLAELQTAFADENYFNNIKNISKCINFLPPQQVKLFQEEIRSQSKSNEIVDLRDLIKLISENEWVKKKFFQFFEIPERFLPRVQEHKPAILSLKPPEPNNPIEITAPFKTLKSYQYDIFERATDRLLPPRARLILQMPTGSGKTRTAMELITHHLNESGDKPCRVIWLANVEELCEQAISCFLEIWQHVGKHNVEVQRVWGRYPKPTESLYKANKQFIVASLQSLREPLADNNSNVMSVISSTTLLIVDECHIAVAPTYAHVVETINFASGCKIIGLTATPGRTIEEETVELSDLFFGEIVSLQDPKRRIENAIEYLRSIKVLSDVTYDQLIVDPGVSVSKSEYIKLQSELDFSPQILGKLGRSSVRTVEIIARLKPLLKEGAQILLFAPSIENSKFLTSLFTFLGYKAAHIDGNTQTKSRHYLISEYLQGNIQILCNYGVLATGFDAPKTDVLCIARPTKSTVLYSQMIGRGLRGPTVGGTEKCLVIEVKDNFLNQGTQEQLYTHFSDYWSD